EPEALTVSAPATSANLGPGFDVLGLALDLGNALVIRRRPGPLVVRVTGEGAGEIPEDDSNLVCRALMRGLDTLDGLEIECRNRIPLGRGLGSSAATVCAGLVAANALGGLRWSPDDLLDHAADMEGHADNAAACLNGGLVAVAPGMGSRSLDVPEGIAFIVVIPEDRISTGAARRAMPAQVPLADAAATLGHAVGLVLALADGDLGRIADHLGRDALHEPYRAPLVPAFSTVRALVDGRDCLGATISGSGPSMLLWCREESAEEVAAAAETALAEAGHDARVRPSKLSRAGVRARWTGGNDLRLARAVG
ncbi:MAG: homoserine kinase, partial [Miltoncostaeaceae bacterium]